MKPYGNYILVKPFPSDNISEGGIIVPDSAKKTSNKVRIIKVGEGTSSKPMKLNEGDIGYRVKDWGTELLIDGELHFIMDQSAIIALEKQ